jgi:hypothetical protein
MRCSGLDAASRTAWGVAAACAESARFVINILLEKLMALIPSFVDEICVSLADDILDIMIHAPPVRGLPPAFSARSGSQGRKTSPKRALAQVVHDRMIALHHTHMCESIAAESEAEEFDSPELEVVKDQFPTTDTDQNLFDSTSIGMFYKELDYLWEVSD